jgi:MYXO-CTERM domain-containing protein
MRRIGLALSLVFSAALASCARPSTEPQDGPVSEAKERIAYGTQDTAHTAVVALLANSGGGSFSECSGTIVQVKNGYGYVLTAAHCCNMGAPSIVVMANDYSVGEQYLFGGTPQPPAYAVDPNSVYYDSKYNQLDHDFCMLKFAGANASTPVIPVAQPGQDGLQIGVAVEHVGYGITDNNNNNSVRRHGTNNVDQNVTTYVIQYSQGGPSHIPGPCEGDSGGPALIPAGASPSQQKVVATTSYGNSASCSQGTVGVSSRVSSETGPGGFISSFLADTPIGTQANSGTPSCNTCVQQAETSTCKSQTTACQNDPACVTLNQCLSNCTTQACQTTCEQQAGTQAVNELNAFTTCICNSACTSACQTECGGSTSTGGNNCGLSSSDATCNTCLDNFCCGEAQACANDSACVSCLGTANPPASCNTNQALISLSNCLGKNCSTPCGVPSSTTSTGTTGATTGGGTTTGSTGSVMPTGGTTAGVGGAGAGGGTGSGGEGNNSKGSGCSVSSTGSAPASPTALAGLLLGAALVISRRRR